MLNRLIIFLLCRKLGVKRFQPFRFVNQNSKHDYYMFDQECLLKYVYLGDCYIHNLSNVKLNWLLDDDCEIVIVDRKSILIKEE